MILQLEKKINDNLKFDKIEIIQEISFKDILNIHENDLCININAIFNKCDYILDNYFNLYYFFRACND